MPRNQPWSSHALGVKDKTQTTRESVLLRTIKQFKGDPNQALPKLWCYVALLHLYKKEDSHKLDNALSKAENTLRDALKSDANLNDELLSHTIEFVHFFLTTARYNIANNLFIEIETAVLEKHGESSFILFSILEKIGLLYQREDR